MFARTAQLVRTANRRLFAWMLLVSALLAADARAQNGLTATVTWDPSVSPSAAGYKVYFGTASGSYTNFVSVDAYTTSTQITNLNPGTTYFVAVKTVDASTNQSAFSREVYFVTPSGPKLYAEQWTSEYGYSYLMIQTHTSIPRFWELDYTLDLVNWYPYDYGNDSPVTAFVPTFYDFLPEMYFRVVVY